MRTVVYAEFMHETNSFSLRRTGEARKASGSFYTPRALTAILVRRTLEPLVAGLQKRGQTGGMEAPGHDHRPLGSSLIHGVKELGVHGHLARLSQSIEPLERCES